MTTLVAYIPFLYPLNVFHELWYLLLLPLAFGISVIYKAVRMHTLERFWREVVVMTLQIVLAMIILALALVVLVVRVVPRLPAE